MEQYLALSAQESPGEFFPEVGAGTGTSKMPGRAGRILPQEDHILFSPEMPNRDTWYPQ